MLNRILKLLTLTLALALATSVLVSGILHAQQPLPELDNIRWKSEEQVRSMLGEPNSIEGPVGTHATYMLWKYDNFTVAFANKRAFHLFSTDSLKKFVPAEEG